MTETVFGAEICPEGQIHTKSVLLFYYIIYLFYILGVVTPDEFVNTESTQPEPEEGLLGFFSTLSTEEMIALACGGAGFLLFIIVIIVIIFKLRKKSKRKKKKAHGRKIFRQKKA